MPKVNQLTPQERAAIVDKSPLSLPNNPTQSGFSAGQIKQKLSGMVTDSEDSVLAILDEKLEEIDDAFTDTDGDVTAINGRLTTVEGKVSTLEGQTLNTRLIAAEADIDQAQTDILALDNTKTDLSYTNAQLALKANLASPALTGIPTAPTAHISTDSTQIATTQFVTTKEQNMFNYVNGVAAIKADSDSPFFTGTPTAPTQPALDNSTKLATTAYADNAVSVLENYTDGQLDLKVNKIQTIIGIDLQDNILLGEFKTALGNATQSVAGLLSSADKTHLDGLVALLDTTDGDNVVDTIGEILAIFNQYPEGADLVTALNGKVDKIAGKGLSTNDITDTLKGNYDTAYSHSQIVTGNPHGSTPADIGAEPANANIQAHVTITNGTNPHQTTFANIASKPTTIAGYGITDAYDKTYIDGLTDFNGWQQTNIATALTNGQTVATSTLTGYDRIMFVCRNTSTGELDTDEITSASVVNGYKINFFENASINFTFGTTTSTFNTTSGFELRVTGAILTQQLAQNINTNETGVSVQTAIDRTNPLDSKIVALNNKSLREVFEGGQLLTNANFDTNTTGWTAVASPIVSVTNGIVKVESDNTNTANRRIEQLTTNGLANQIHYVNVRARLSSGSGTTLFTFFNGTSIVTPITSPTFVNLSLKSSVSSNTSNILQLNVLNSIASIEVDYAYVYNLTTLGITHLTQAQLDEYFALYLKYKQTDNWFADLDVRKANRFIDIPVAELGNRTLREMFVGNNLTTNPEFDNGTAGWSDASFGGSIIAVDSVLTQTAGSGQNYPYIFQNNVFPSATDQYYINVRARVDNSVATSLKIESGTSDFSVVPIANQWYRLSYIRIPNDYSALIIQHIYSTGAVASGKKMEVDYAYAYNLTQLGLTSLSIQRLNYYFDLYLQYRTDNGLVAVADALQLLREDNREQDKRIADIEENLRKANSGAITTTASGTDVISLGKDTNNAPAQIGVDGGLLQTTQLVNGGNFVDALTIWSPNSVTHSLVGARYRIQIINVAGEKFSASNLPIQPAGSKIYFVASIHETNTSPLFIIYNRKSDGTYQQQIQSTSNFMTIESLFSTPQQFVRLWLGTSTDDTLFATFNYAYAFNISTLQANKQYSPLFNTTFDLMTDANIKTQMDLWVADGTLPNNNIQAVAMNKRVRSVGKNLLDDFNLITTRNQISSYTKDGNRYTFVGTTGQFSFVRTINPFIQLQPLTQYTFSLDVSSTITTYIHLTATIGQDFNDLGQIVNITSTLTRRSVTFTTSATGLLNIAMYANIQGPAGTIVWQNLQIERGNVASPYTQYNTSDAFLQPNTLGYSLPNGTRDAIEFRNGKYYFVKRVQERTLVASDVVAFTSATTNFDIVYIKKPSNFIFPTTTYTPQQITRIGTLAQETTYLDNANRIGTIFSDASADKWGLAVVKGTYADLAAAKTAFTGTEVYYLLATPIETEILSLGIPQSYQGGTIYVDEMMADADLYTTNALISNTAYPIKTLDRIVRINADGSQTELAISGATIAGDKLSFTHTGLVANDIVWFSYTYDIANTFKSLTTATYYDNPFIAVAPNGTARRLVPSVDNAGVVVWSSVAI
jgi:hypothetical protein